jgi:hypothetical protein
MDMTAFPEPITAYRQHRPATQQERRRPTAAENYPLNTFRSVKEADDVRVKATDYMQTYGDNHTRRNFQIHQDWEERYMRPLHGRMKTKLNGRNYSAFRETRSRAVTALQEKSGVKLTGLGSGPLYNPLDDNDAAELPYVRIPTRGLEDRVHGYQQRAESESELSSIVNEINGPITPPPPLKERMTIDPVGWKFLPETRNFYDPKDATKVRKGRRAFPGIMQAKIQTILDQFDP